MYQHAFNWLERRSPRLGKLLRWFLRVSMWDLHYGVSELLLGISALVILLAVAIGVDGWTTGNEKYWSINGIVLLVVAVLQQRNRGKTLIQLYRIYKRDQNSQVEARSMGFDIREPYIDRILHLLNKDYPETFVYGRYFTPLGVDSETPRFFQDQLRNWENRANKRIRSLCFAWEQGAQRFRIEYRRTPAQIYADRFIETTGLEEAEHNRLREILLQEEWACRPRFGWITKMGLYWISLIGAAVIFLFLGQPTLHLSTGDPSSFGMLTLMARALFVTVLLILAVSAALSGLRAYYFPAGIFRIDEEVQEQKAKDTARGRLVKCALFALLGLIGVLVVDPVSQLCSGVEDNGIDFFSKMRWHLSESPVCKYIVPRVLK